MTGPGPPSSSCLTDQEQYCSTSQAATSCYTPHCQMQRLPALQCCSLALTQVGSPHSASRKQCTSAHAAALRELFGVQADSCSYCSLSAGLISCFAVSSAGRYVVSGSVAGAVKLWSLTEGLQLDIQEAAHPAGVSALAFLGPAVVSHLPLPVHCLRSQVDL